MKETEKTLDSLDALERARMPDALRSKLEALIPDIVRPRILMLRKPVLLLAAAGLALLIGMNVLTISRHLRNGQRAPYGQIIADQYFAPSPSL